MRSWLVPGLVLVLAACSSANAATIDTPTPAISFDATASPVGTPLPGNLDRVVFIEDDREYVIQQLIQRDGIRPIYDPQFVSAEDAPYQPGELVMGVEVNGDARAYSVGVLRSREMVDDVVGGTPILVTW